MERNRCRKCKAFYSADYILDEENCKKGIPICEKCGGIIKPEVVLYGEGLDEECIRGAVNAIAAADMLIVGGTSLAVYPAAGFIQYFKGENFVLINKSSTPYDRTASLIYRDPIGEVLGACVLDQ